jgi:DNA-binding NarL/FixJ family response regulator
VIDVIIADHQEVFRIGMAEVLGAEGDIRVVGKPKSLIQLMYMLTTVSPHVLILSRDFLPAFSKLKRTWKRHQSALLVLTEDDDPIAYVRLLRAQGILYRSMEGPEMVDAVRRVARVVRLAQNLSSHRAPKSSNRPAA